MLHSDCTEANKSVAFYLHTHNSA